jgi:hypothetical protein
MPGIALGVGHAPKLTPIWKFAFLTVGSLMKTGGWGWGGGQPVTETGPVKFPAAPES